VHPTGGTSGRARREQSGLDAAIIALVYDADYRLALAEELAGAFLDGPWRAEALAERGSGTLDRWPAWMDALAFAATAFDRVTPVNRRTELVRFIDAFLCKRAAGPGDDRPPQILRHLSPQPPAPAYDWPVAQIDTVASLAERLELSAGQLAWLADVRGLERTVDREQLRNYRYRWMPRRSGLPRLIEAPKARLKEIQRWVLHEILDHVPPHGAAHGFTRGRSVLTHAAVHTGQSVVLRLDLRDFFASVSAARVYGLFRALGYGHSVAHALTGLCTNTTPTIIWNAAERPTEPWLIQPHFWLGRQLATPHVPQGAPTSPALANLAAFGIDRRLTGLSAAFSMRYTRYADDLTFSGPRMTGRANRTLIQLAARIIDEEGFRLHHGKSSLRSGAQRQLVTGVVVNETPNVPRVDYDRLKARLHRLKIDGPNADNPGRPVDLQAHLRGRVDWVASLNPRRGEKLRRLLDAINWDHGRQSDQ
jgi:retron-type reverse transcriptase